MAVNAKLIEFLASSRHNPVEGRLWDDGAIVAFFIPGTSTGKAVWEDRLKSLPTASGLTQSTLGSDGSLTLFGDGVYDIKIYDESDTGLTAPLKTYEGVNISDATVGTEALAFGVSSISDLRELATSSSFENESVIIVKGYYAAGDGGGGDFYWDETSSETDNNGTIIKVTSIVTGRWKRIYSGPIIDKFFGVRRDDSTNDGAELLAVLAFVQSIDGILEFTSGVAKSDSELSLDTALCSIVGPGKEISSIEVGSSFPLSGTLLTITDSGRTAGVGSGEQPYHTGNEKAISLKGFSLSGDQRAARAHGLYFAGLNDDAETDLNVYDFKGYGVSVGEDASADTMRESKFNLHVKNCGDNRDGNDIAMMQIESGDSVDGHNNLWFRVLRLVYPRGAALRVLPNNTNTRTRKIDVDVLWLHGNAQLPIPPATDPQGEEWFNAADLVQIGNAGGAGTEVATINVGRFYGVGLETGQVYFDVLRGGAINLNAFAKGTIPATSYFARFTEASSSSIRNHMREEISVGSTGNGLNNLINVVSMQGTQHHVHVSGLGGTTITNGEPGYTGDLKYLIDEDSDIGQTHHIQDSAASNALPPIGLALSGRGRRYIQRLTIVPASSLVANDNDYATINFIKIDPGGGFGASVGSITTQTTGSGDWVAGTPIEVTIATSRLDQGEGIAVQIAKSGSGVVVPHASLMCELSPNLSVV